MCGCNHEDKGTRFPKQPFDPADPLGLGPLDPCPNGSTGLYGVTSLGPGLTLLGCSVPGGATPGGSTMPPTGPAPVAGWSTGAAGGRWTGSATEL